MRRALSIVVLAGVVILMFPVAAKAALPSESPANTYQVNGPRVRSAVIVGNNVWIGGIFTQVQSGSGSNVRAVSNLAALDRTTGQLSSATPLALAGTTGAEVWKLATDGTTVYASGKFALSSGGFTYRNLVAFNGTTGALVTAFKPTSVPVAHSVTVGGGAVYAGGKRLVAYNASNGAAKPGFVTSSIVVDPAIRGHNIKPQHRDLQLIGGFLYSACQCDSLTQSGSTRAVKALVRFNPSTGAHDQAFTPEAAGSSATGLSVTTDGTEVYLGAGGSDYVARYSQTATHGASLVGKQVWKRDTSGSAQAVEVSGSDLLVGGHFTEIADAAGDACGFKSSDPGTLDPNDECQTRNRLAAYSLTGTLSAWNPSVTGKYNGIWSIALDGTRVHLGGEFTSVHGVTQRYYARLA